MICKVCHNNIQLIDMSTKGYNKNGTRKYSNTCKKCFNEYMRIKQQQHRAIRRDYINEYKESHGCSVCGDKRYYVLEFHHINNDKDIAVSKIVQGFYPMSKLIDEITKCIVVCANCHREIHYNQQAKE